MLKNIKSDTKNFKVRFLEKCQMVVRTLHVQDSVRDMCFSVTLNSQCIFNVSLCKGTGHNSEVILKKPWVLCCKCAIFLYRQEILKS